MIFSRETFYHTFIGILIYLAQTGQASDIELYNGNLFNLFNKDMLSLEQCSVFTCQRKLEYDDHGESGRGDCCQQHFEFLIKNSIKYEIQQTPAI